MAKDAKDLLKVVGITKDELDAARYPESVFVAYTAANMRVEVEIIAPNFAELLLQLPVHYQEKLIANILPLVREPGDVETIEDSLDDGKKRRAVRVFRMKPQGDNFANLLITR